MAAKTSVTLDDLRRHALSRSLFSPTTLPRAIERLGFVQADPIRAPARAQDLVLRHRVAGYRAGDLEARYPKLAIEEDFFVNYGFLPRDVAALMHPRAPSTTWPKTRRAQAQAVLDFVRERGVVHPRDVDAAFDHGRSKNWFGGLSRASTQLLDEMHYRGLVRTAAREGGVRLYAAREPQAPPADADAALDALADRAVALYAPLPERSLSELLRRIRYGTPQWTSNMSALVARTQARLASASVAGQRWYWPADENPASRRHRRIDDDDRLHLLAPFDPVVWDRRRFEALWGWAYRFEAYVPAAQRQRGYYALPLLWRGGIAAWANVSVRGDGPLAVAVGHCDGHAPRDPAFKAALAAETARLAGFLVPRSSRA